MQRAIVSSIEAPWARVRLAAMDIAEAAEARCATGLDSAGVHGLRVSCKRLRALWRLLESTLGAQRIQGPDRALREASRALTGHREGAVLIKTVRRLAQTSAKRADRALLAVVEAQLASRIEVEQFDQTTLAYLRSVMRRQRSELASLPCLFGPADLAWGMDRSSGRARKAGRRALTARDPDRVTDAWHRCRRWVKYEYYQIDLCLPAPGRQLRRRRRALARLGVLLGRYNDLGDLERHLALHLEGPSETPAERSELSQVPDARGRQRLRRLVARSRARLLQRIVGGFRRLYGSGRRRSTLRRLERRLARPAAGLRTRSGSGPLSGRSTW